MKRALILIAIAVLTLPLAAQTNIADDVTSNTTWAAGEYTLDGLVFVHEGVTLTIEPGAVIKGKKQENITTGDGASALIVRRGATIMAEGTADSPIIFTSEDDDVNNSNDLGPTDRGLWGGLIVLGYATTNQPTTDNQVEGIPPELDALYGGTEDEDNSGVLKYISIRHGGFSISGTPGDEINGLTLGAVGSGTTISHIEVYANFDDGYEWFGGTVRTKYLAAAFCADDAFDYDQGFRGLHQFWFSVQGPDEAGRGGEHDGGDDNETGMPYAKPYIANATYLGSGKDATPAGDGNDRAIYFRDNAGGKYVNSIFYDFVGVGVKVEDLTSGEDSRSRMENGDLVLANNYWYEFGAGNDLNGMSEEDFVRDHLVANDNAIADPLLRGVDRLNPNGIDPRLRFDSPAIGGATVLPDPFFTSVGYRGAFDPNEDLWLLGWSALDRNGHLGDLDAGTPGEVNVTDDVTTNTTWTANNVYTLDGLIFVHEGVNLTIEAGTVIKGKKQANITTGDGASALIVRRGATIHAEGSAASPIIFTSEDDDVNNSNDLGPVDRGLWGGVILLGYATTNQPTTDNQIEGIPPELDALYGGTDDADSSGVFRYVSIRHGGFSISGTPGDEINGLTMGALGSRTVIDHIEVYANFDDGYEWFGGTVNTKNLIAAFCADDSYDYDQGFRGNHQFWFSIQGPDEAGRAGEHDGGDDNETGMPYAIPNISNVTYIGSGKDATPAGDGNDRAIYFRDNAGGKYYSSIFYDFVGVGVKVEDLGSGEDSRSRMENGDLVLGNNYWYEFGAGNDLNGMSEEDFVRDHLVANGNTIADPQLNSVSRFQDGNLDPRPFEGGAAASGGGSTVPGDSHFEQVDYYGAFDPAGGLWSDGWTALDANGHTADVVTGIVVEDVVSSEIPQRFLLSQNYPNPFNPSTNIKFELPISSEVRLTVFNIRGQRIATLVEGFRAAGSYVVTWDASNDVTSGIYFYRFEAGGTVETKKMMLVR